MVRSGVGKPNILFGWPKLTYNIARQVSICKLTNTANQFLEVIFAFGEIFFNQRVLLQLDLHWRQPQTSMTNATNLRTFCFKDHRYESFFLSRDSLSGATHSLDIIQVYIFIPSDTFRPILALFKRFAYTNFFICILPCRIFFLSLNDAVDRKKLEI